MSSSQGWNFVQIVICRPNSSVNWKAYAEPEEARRLIDSGAFTNVLFGWNQYYIFTGLSVEFYLLALQQRTILKL